MKILTLLACVILLLTGCNQSEQGKAMISGKLTDASGERLILQELGSTELHNLDSVTVDTGGHFLFELAPAERGFYLLQAGSGKVLVVTLDKGEQVIVTGDFAEFPDRTRIEGSADNALLQSFFEFTRKNEQRVDSLENLLVERQDSADYYPLTLRLDTAFKQIWELQRDYEKSFIDQNPGSLVSLIVLNYAFGMSPVLSPAEDSVYYLKLDKSLGAKYPDNKHVAYHHQRIMEFRRQQEVKNLRK